MASRIKGITVEIGGDTTGLDKALSGVDKEIKSTSSNLRDVNKLLRFDPKNTALLKQKQELLGKQIDSTKDRLKTLKEADKEAKRQLDNGDIGKDKYDALQREIADTENSLKGLKSQKMKLDTQGVQNFATGLKNVGGQLSKVSAGIVAVGAAAIKSAKDLDDGYDTIVTATGASGEKLEGLREVANNVFTTMATDMDTVGAAVGEINTKFGVTGSKAQSMTEKFIKFSEITGTDVTSSVDNAYNVMQKWNLSQDDTIALLDQIAGVAQDTGIGVESLFSAITENADTLSELGIGAEQAVGFMAQLEKAGIDSSTGVKALKFALKSATAEGKSMEEFLKENVNAMLNAKTHTEAMGIATETFGNKNAATMLAALQDGRLSLQDLTGSMSDYEGRVNETYQNTQDPWDKMDIAINNVKLAGAQLGADIAERLVPVIEKLISVVQSIVNWWDSLSSGQKEVIETIALVIAIVGPLLLLIGHIITGVLSLTAATTALNISLGPILLIIAAIIAIIVIIIVVVKNWGKISDWIKKKFELLKAGMAKIWNAIKSVFTTVINAIKAVVTRIFTAIVNAIKFRIMLVKTVVTTIWNAIKTVFTTVVNFIKTYVIGTFTKIVGGIKSVLSKVTSTVSGAFKGAISFITGLPKKAIEWGKDFIQGLINGIKKMIGKITGAVKGIAKKIKNFFHFSRPDTGPLRDYEKWMPDFMKGLAKGINDNKFRIEDAIKDVSSMMSIDATVSGNNATSLSDVSMKLSALIHLVQEGKVIKLDRREIGRIRT